MLTDFKDSQTRLNLMRAFAGESMARNRYTFAAGAAKTANLHVIETVFTYTADQEKEHAKIFQNHLTQLGVCSVPVDGDYPIDVGDMIALLRQAHHNEYQEYEEAYPAFGRTAEQEGFAAIAESFFRIAEIEKTHGDRFLQIAEAMAADSLFSAGTEAVWICQNCGHIHRGNQAPLMCSVCSHAQGYFLGGPAASALIPG